jgi:O-antigen/teichoic acid export membrane protein
MFDIKNNLSKIKVIVDKFHGITKIGAATISSTVISGLFWFYVAGLLGTSDYGEVSYIVAISGSVLTFLLFGGGNSFLVFIPKGVKIQPPVYVISLIAISIASVVLYFIFYDIGLCLLVIGNGVFGLVVSELLGLKSYKKYALYFIVQRILMVIIAISLYHIIGFNGIIIGIGLSYFPAFLQVYQVFKDHPKIDFSIIKSHIQFLFTSYVLDITRTFATTIDKIIIAPMLGFALLGNYQIGIQVLSVLMILPGVLYSYTVPHDASGNTNKRLKIVGVLVSAVLVIPTIIFSPIVIPIILPEFTESITVIQLVSISLIPITISTLYISKFLGEERIKIVLIGSGMFIAIQIVGIFILGEIYSVNGVAIAYLIATTSESIYLFIVDRWGSKNKSKLIVNKEGDN